MSKVYPSFTSVCFPPKADISLGVLMRFRRGMPADCDPRIRTADGRYLEFGNSVGGSNARLFAEVRNRVCGAQLKSAPRVGLPQSRPSSLHEATTGFWPPRAPSVRT